MLRDIEQGKCVLRAPDWSNPEATLRKQWYKLKVNGIIDKLGEAACLAYHLDVAAQNGVSEEVAVRAAHRTRYNTDTRHVDLRQFVAGAKAITRYEYAAPCPKCGGKDRFHLRQGSDGWRCFCRQCTGADHWMDPIEFLRWRDGLDFKSACEKLALPTMRQAPRPPVKPLKRAPDPRLTVIAKHIKRPPLAYLQSRGISESTAKRAKLGWSAGRSVDGIYVPRGLTIPCWHDGQVAYIKVRTDDGYRQVKGGLPAPYCARSEGAHAIVVETELDALMLADRCEQLEAPIAIFATGSVSWNLDAAPRLRARYQLWTAFDNDDAGLAAARKWRQPRLEYKGKDIGEVYERAGWQGIDDILRQVAPIKGYADRLIDNLGNLGKVEVNGKVIDTGELELLFEGRWNDVDGYKAMVKAALHNVQAPFTVLHTDSQGERRRARYVRTRD